MSISPTLGGETPSQFPCIAQGWGSGGGVLLTGALYVQCAVGYTVIDIIIILCMYCMYLVHYDHMISEW